MSLENDAVVTRLDRLCRLDRNTGAEVVAHLVVMEERGLHFDLGYSSVYTYATERLKMSEDVALKRIRAARVAKDFPEVIDMLASGELTLSTVLLIARAPSKELLELAKGKSQREVSKLVSNDWPRGQLLKVEVSKDGTGERKASRLRARWGAVQFRRGRWSSVWGESISRD